MRVALFGLGTMGLPMARTLLDAGVDLVATDKVAAARDAFAADDQGLSQHASQSGEPR